MDGSFSAMYFGSLKDFVRSEGCWLEKAILYKK